MSEEIGEACSPSALDAPVAVQALPAQRSTIERVERILDAALEYSPIFEGRETYVPLPLLRDVVRELAAVQMAGMACRHMRVVVAANEMRCADCHEPFEQGVASPGEPA